MEIPEFFAVCDFCGTWTDDLVEYAADEEVVPVEITALDGSQLRTVFSTPAIWRSCLDCARLVEAEDRVGLLERSERIMLGHVRALVALTPTRRRQFMRERRRGLVRLHAKFWRGIDDDEGESAA